MSTSSSFGLAHAVATTAVPIFTDSTAAIAGPASARHPNALDVLLITSNEDSHQTRATLLGDLAQLQQVPMQTLYVEQLAGSSKEEKIAALKQQLQELHRSGKIDAHTQVIISMHGTIYDGPHRLANKPATFSIGTSDMVSLIRETGRGVTPSSDSSGWQGTIHINACGAGRASEDLKDGAGMTLLYAGKKVTCSFNSFPIYQEMIRQLGEYRKDPAANEFPSAQDLFSTAGSISGEKVHMAGQGNLVQIRSGYLPHPSELTEAAVLERLKLSLLAKIVHGKPENVQKAIDLLGPALKNIKAYPPLLLALNDLTTAAEEKVKMLLRAGEDINQRFPSGDTPLHVACKNSTKELVSLLLQQGADIHAVDKQGQSALSLAIKEKRLDLIELLIAAGADANTTMPDGNSVLHLAVEEGNDQLIELLLDKGANLHQKNADGETPLSKLIHRGEFRKAMSLLSRRDQQNKVADVYGTGLIRRIILGNFPMLASALLNISSDKNAQLKKLFIVIDANINIHFKSNFSSIGVDPEHEILLFSHVKDMLRSNSRMPDYFKNFLSNRRADKSIDYLEYILNIPGFMESMAADMPAIRKIYQAAGFNKGCECIDAALARKSLMNGGVAT